MKKKLKIFVVFLLTVFTFTSCDVLLECLAAGLMSLNYPSYTSNDTGGNYGYSTLQSNSSSSSSASSSSGYIHAQSDLNYYRKMEENVKHGISTLHLYEGSSLVRMKQTIREEQREMQKTRLEAQRNNFHIDQSPYETMSF